MLGVFFCQGGEREMLVMIYGGGRLVDFRRTHTSHGWSFALGGLQVIVARLEAFVTHFMPGVWESRGSGISFHVGHDRDDVTITIDRYPWCIVGVWFGSRVSGRDGRMYSTTYL